MVLGIVGSLEEIPVREVKGLRTSPLCCSVHLNTNLASITGEDSIGGKKKLMIG